MPGDAPADLGDEHCSVYDRTERVVRQPNVQTLAKALNGHLSAKGQPLEIEILDASKMVQKKDVEISMEVLFSTT
jgi:hypothetical protein